MKRLVLVALFVLGLGAVFTESPALASHYPPLNLHWTRTAASGSDSKQVLIYLQDETEPDQDFLVTWIAGSISQHPEVSLRKVSVCPANRHCIIARTNPATNGGLATVSWGENSHMLTALVEIANTVPETGLEQAKNIFWHEFCHAFGGGFTETFHYQCNIPYRAHHRASITKYYHDDPG